MRLIDADELIIMQLHDENDTPIGPRFVPAELIEDAPTVEAEPVKHGRNIATEYNDVDEFICSECGLHLENWVSVEVDEDTGEKTYHEFRLRRCPCCSAKIDEVEE